MHNNSGEKSIEGLENHRKMFEELIMYKSAIIDMKISNEELTKCAAKIDAKKKEMDELIQQADEIKAQKEILLNDFEEFQKSCDIATESEDEADIYESQLLAMHAAMLDLKEQQEILCDRMEEIVKNYKALNAEFECCTRKAEERRNLRFCRKSQWNQK